MMKEKQRKAQRQPLRRFGKRSFEPVRKPGRLPCSILRPVFGFPGALSSGQYAPFGVVMVSAVPYGNLWFAAAGAVLGYLFSPLLSIPARYIAAVLAVAAIRWTLNDLDRLKNILHLPRW